MRQQVDADQIGQAEDAGLRDAEGPAHHGIGLLDAQTLRKGLGHRRLHPETAEPVGDEARAVLAMHGGLAQPMIGEAADRFHGFGIGRGAGDDFE